MLRLIGIVPLGIGLIVLNLSWSSEFGGGFGVPIFFRLFFSFIALAFVTMGGGLLLKGGPFGSTQRLIDRALDMQQQLEASMRARGMTPPSASDNGPSGLSMTSAGYRCPSCNAPI